MRSVKKHHLPSKLCANCWRPFAWREKMERCWNEIRCCNDRCRGLLQPGPPPAHE
ncbi:MAG TPA: DUF2256 domain-containing protein [Verrucomicrobiales bacterium]|nr:DUF2256 domain-containing protein [Verrucomicrobiales bacterium]